MAIPADKQIQNVDANGAATTVPPAQHTTKAETTGPRNTTTHVRLKRTRPHYIRIALIAYGSALALTGVMIPIVASIIMAGIYLARPSVSLFSLDPTLKWFPLLSSTIITLAIWLFAALCGTFFTTAKAANAGNYGQLISRLCQLKANLGIEDADDNSARLGQRFGDIGVAQEKIKAVQRYAATNVDQPRNPTALNDAYTCYIDISKMLNDSPTGLLWAAGIGYINAWRLLHNAEEALIELDCVEEVIRGAIHDKLAIQGSTISRQDELLTKLVQAATTLEPAADVYFKEHQPGPGDPDLNQLIDSFKRKVLQQVKDDNNLNDTQNQVDPEKAKALARVTLREVRGTLNDFRDKSWEGIVRARNRLLGSIAVTGIVTHVLLGVAIMTSSVPNATNHVSDAIMAAVTFYLVGAVTGLFGRFYRESVAGTAVDDFGFSTARLVATPLLSGLAGVGGVMLTVMLASMGSTLAQANTIGLGDIFRMDPRLFFIAAIFGLTPNLLIKGLQEKASKYESDIQSSKAAEPSTTSTKT